MRRFTSWREKRVDGGGWEGEIHGCGLATNQGLNILADATIQENAE